MRLWTFQFPFIMRRLRRDGVYRPRWAEVSTAGPAWMLAYDWMVEELVASRLLKHGHAPIWAWHRTSEIGPPDLQTAESLFGSIGKDVVRLEIEVPDRNVVLSEYGAWNTVIDLAFDCVRDRTALVVPDALRTRVFSIECALAAADDDSFELQACLPALRWRNVCGIQRFTLPGWETLMTDDEKRKLKKLDEPDNAC